MPSSRLRRMSKLFVKPAVFRKSKSGDPSKGDKKDGDKASPADEGAAGASTESAAAAEGAGAAEGGEEPKAGASKEQLGPEDEEAKVAYGLMAPLWGNQVAIAAETQRCADELEALLLQEELLEKPEPKEPSVVAKKMDPEGKSKLLKPAAPPICVSTTVVEKKNELSSLLNEVSELFLKSKDFNDKSKAAWVTLQQKYTKDVYRKLEQEQNRLRQQQEQQALKMAQEAGVATKKQPKVSKVQEEEKPDDLWDAERAYRISVDEATETQKLCVERIKNTVETLQAYDKWRREKHATVSKVFAEKLQGVYSTSSAMTVDAFAPVHEHIGVLSLPQGAGEAAHKVPLLLELEKQYGADPRADTMGHTRTHKPETLERLASKGEEDSEGQGVNVKADVAALPPFYAALHQLIREQMPVSALVLMSGKLERLSKGVVRKLKPTTKKINITSKPLELIFRYVFE